MKVGYISQLNIVGIDKKYSKWVKYIYNESCENELDYLILAGGISNNYQTTLSFVNELGKQLEICGTKLRFIVGNTDLYYDEAVVDKSKKVREILEIYSKNKYYLPKFPILTRYVRIIGNESWYDYSLYRGKDISLENVTKKKKLWYVNKDNKYITDKNDYCLGLDSIFDTIYTKSCISGLSRKLDAYQRKHGDCKYNVVVQYFKTDKQQIPKGVLSKYKGTFEGSAYVSKVLKNYGVTQCVIGSKCRDELINIDGVHYINSLGKVKVIEYVSQGEILS